MKEKKKKDKENNKSEKQGERDTRGVYIPTEDEVIEKRKWSEINKL